MMVLFLVLAAVAVAWLWTRGGAREDYQRARHDAVQTEADRLRSSLELAYADVHDYRTARDADWDGLDRAYYERAGAELEREGFAVVADLVDETLVRAFPNLRTVIRVLLGDGGRVRGAVYHLRTLGRLRLLQWIGLVPRRLQFIECVSELEGGDRFVSTASSQGVDRMSMPDSIQLERLPPTTTPTALLARHRERLARLEREVFVVMRDAADVLRSVQRGHVIVARHRAGVGPLTDEEARALAGRPLTPVEQELIAALRRDRSAR